MHVRQEEKEGDEKESGSGWLKLLKGKLKPWCRPGAMAYAMPEPQQQQKHIQHVQAVFPLQFSQNQSDISKMLTKCKCDIQHFYLIV